MGLPTLLLPNKTAAGATLHPSPHCSRRRRLRNRMADLCAMPRLACANGQAYVTPRSAEESGKRAATAATVYRAQRIQKDRPPPDPSADLGVTADVAAHRGFSSSRAA